MCLKLIITFVNCSIFPLATSIYQTTTIDNLCYIKKKLNFVKIWGFDITSMLVLSNAHSFERGL